MATSRHLSDLTVLSLVGNQIGDAGAAVLANAPILAALEELDLMNNAIGAAARALASSRYLTDLRSLKLIGNELDRADVHLLQKPSATGCAARSLNRIPRARYLASHLQ